MKKNALITGASSGVGLAISRALIEREFKVEGIARDFSATECDGLIQHSIDLSDLEQLPNRLSETANNVDLLVLNAGYGRFGGIEQFSYAQIRELLDTNLVSHLFLLKYFLPQMKKKGAGDIVIVGSESALQGARAGAVYCASKFALRGLAQSLRADCSTAGIRVILVNPGPVNTGFFDELTFSPADGVEFIVEPESVATAMEHPRNVVLEEVNIQPMNRSLRKK